MSLYEQFNQLFNRQEIAIATITGQKGGGKLTAQSENGATILLTGELETGKKCYYDRRTGQILSEAPNIPYNDYPV